MVASTIGTMGTGTKLLATAMARARSKAPGMLQGAKHVTAMATTLAAMVITALSAPRLHAQEHRSSSPAVDRELERLLVEPDDEQGDLDFEELLELHEHPLDLRAAASTELARLPSIDLQAAIAIVDVVRRLQPLDHRALATMIALSPRQALSLRAFTTLAVDTSARRLRGSARVRVERDLAVRRGYRDRLRRVVREGADDVDTIDLGPVYRGAPEGLLAQLALVRGPLAIAATIASDRGEPLTLRDTTAYSYDRLDSADETAAASPSLTRLTSFVSASLAWERPWLTAIAGDFTAELGQGLLVADARRRFSRSDGASSAYVAARRLAPYRSSDETSFLRGLAAEAIVDRPLPFRLRLLALASWRWLDASLDTLTDVDGARVPVVASLRHDGYRRTMSEIRRGANALERVAAVNAAVEDERWAVGVSALHSDLRAEGGPVTRKLTRWSIDARASSRSVTTYGECAFGAGSAALVAGVIVRSASFTSSLAARNLPAGTELLHGRAFPQGGAPVPERGIFASVETALSDRLRLALAIDLAAHPLPTASTPFPSSSSDVRLRLDWTLDRRLRLAAALDRAIAPKAATVTDALGREHRGRLDVERTHAGIVLGGEPVASLALRLRLDARSASSDGASARGLLAGIDLRLSASRGLDLIAGFAIFDTDDAAAAVFLPEADLPGRVRSTQLSGAGRRVSAAVRWQPTDELRVSASIAETAYADRRRIGDGLEAIDASRGATASLQIDWRIDASAMTREPD